MRPLLADDTRHGLWLAALAALLLFAQLGATPLANFDDCYYAQKAKEMVRTGDWLIPHYDGVPRFDNAPLFLWLMALSFTVFGISNFAAILPSTLAGVACVWLVHRLALRLGYPGFAAWCAGFVLLTTLYFTKYARHAMFDVFLTLLFLAAMDAYLTVLAGRRRAFLAIGLAAGLGLLTKSVLGLFPWAVIVLHLIWTGRHKLLLDHWLRFGLALTLGAALPWYVYAYATHGERFLHEHVRWLLFERAFALEGHDRTIASYFDYLRMLATTYWPWLPVAAVGLWHAGRRAFRAAAWNPATAGLPSQDAARLLLLWLTVVIGAMSVADEKKLWYVMSVFPGLALLAAAALAAWVRAEGVQRQVTRAGYGVLAVAALLFQTGLVRISRDRDPGLHRVALAARDLVPAGTKVANLDQEFWSVNNLFLYYSDHSVTPPLGEPAALLRELEAGRPALLREASYVELAREDSSTWLVAARGAPWVLVLHDLKRVDEPPAGSP